MRKGREATSAKFIQTLVYHDGPQLLLLESDRGLNMLAVAIDRDDMENAFFACEMREKVFNKYIHNKADLGFVFRSTPRNRFYFFSLDDSGDGNIELTPAHANELYNSEYWPGPGFFSYSHTHDIIQGERYPSVSQAYNIDGSWEPSEFSRFSNKISDIYAFLFMTGRLADAQSAQSDRLLMKGIVSGRLWQGGGSYIGFYDEIASRVSEFNPLELDRIHYASPGEIVFRGEAQVFAEISQTVKQFAENTEELKSRYRLLNGILAKEKLKRADKSKGFSSRALEDQVAYETNLLAKSMRIPEAEKLRELCESTVIYCKVVLSYYRRVEALNTFRSEGRLEVAATVNNESMGEG